MSALISLHINLPPPELGLQNIGENARKQEHMLLTQKESPTMGVFLHSGGTWNRDREALFCLDAGPHPHPAVPGQETGKTP